MVGPKDYAPICLSLEEVTVRAGHEVLTEVDDNNVLIVGDPQGILVHGSGLTQPANYNNQINYF
jgi:hypothetical protein